MDSFNASILFETPPKNLALTKSVASIFCIVLNIKTIRLDFVSHEVLAYPMFGMISQLMFMMLLKVGSIIQKERISIIANLIWNKLFRALRYHRSALIVVDG